MLKANKKEIIKYFEQNTYSTYKDLARKFQISTEWTRQKSSGFVISSLNKNGIYITSINKKFDKNGFFEKDGIIFSRYGNVKNTLLHLIKTNDNICSKKIKEIMPKDVSKQISRLVKEKKIFYRKSGHSYYYSLNPKRDHIVTKDIFNIQSLDKKDKVLRDLEIIRQIKSGKKKTEIATDFKMTTRAISIIYQKFVEGKTKKLIHTRKPKITKVSSAQEAAIITESIKYPEKSPKEIQKSITQPVSIDKIKTIQKSIEPKKKLLLKIE